MTGLMIKMIKTPAD